MGNDKEVDTILINKMYVGDYLGDNIGHEVINLLKADNDKNYIYILDDGTINGKWDEKIKTILLARQAEINTWEILAKATVKKQLVKQSSKELPRDKEARMKKLHKQNTDDLRDVTYGGQTLNAIFAKNIRVEKSIFATFKVENVLRPQKPL